MTITKVLIANRGEIASRIIATCTARGVQTVAIYCTEDAQSPYVFAASEHHALSKSGSAAYLDTREIIDIAVRCGVSAIHPGYGFLAENAAFARAVIDAGLTWIGPAPETIDAMGCKASAREVMQAAGVPVLAGKTIDGDADEIAALTGYPLLLKAALGGGGKAMRKVEGPEELATALATVTREAKALFSSTTIIAEKYLENARHVEVQIAGDGQQYVHLYERECSIQRRHQKVIEEAPCSFISQGCKDKLYEYALLATRAVHYRSVGTVEFLVTANEQIYFLEMNTRLQVEHPVTEMVTGIDLVGLQLDIAQGTLPLSQEDISLRGHAIEVRINAENHNFMPSTGTIALLNLPEGPFVRLDHNLCEGVVVTPYFDPMLAKLICYGQTRGQAMQNLQAALQQFAIAGIESNIDLLAQIISTKEFTLGAYHTKWLEDTTFTPAALDTETILAIAQATKTPQRAAQSNTITTWKREAWQR